MSERGKRCPRQTQTWQPVNRDLTGWLARYQKLVTNASQGGVLDN